MRPLLQTTINMVSSLIHWSELTIRLLETPNKLTTGTFQKENTSWPKFILTWRASQWEPESAETSLDGICHQEWLKKKDSDSKRQCSTFSKDSALQDTIIVWHPVTKTSPMKKQPTSWLKSISFSTIWPLITTWQQQELPQTGLTEEVSGSVKIKRKWFGWDKKINSESSQSCTAMT